MSEENGRERRSILPWAQFGWTIAIAILGGVVSGTGAFHGLREQMRHEVRAEVQLSEHRIRQELAGELRTYLPLAEWWKWREEFNRAFYRIEAKLDRIEQRIR